MSSEKKVSSEKYDKYIKDWEEFHDKNPDYKHRHGTVFVEMSMASIQDQVAALLYATRTIPENVEIEYISLWGAFKDVDWSDDCRKMDIRDGKTVELRVDFLKPKLKKTTELEVIKNF